jgi:P63C domain-containing protein
MDNNIKKRKVKYEGELNLAGFKIPCYVLEDGTRVLSGRGMQETLKMVDETDEGKQASGARLKRYLGQKSLEPFIYREKKVGHYDPIICYKGDAKINGYEATTLVDICDGFLEARNYIELSPRQAIIAEQCEILVRSFAKVGIIALIDEATGYQKVREETLQAILKLYISEEVLEWQKTFHKDFYEQIFRLWNLPSTPESMKIKPSFIGTLTNKLIYENLPEGSFVLPKLKEKTPKTKGGHWRYKLHQSLTETGREALKKVIYSVEALASISKTKPEFLRLVEEKYHSRPSLLSSELDTDDKEGRIKTDFDRKFKALLSVPSPEKDE